MQEVEAGGAAGDEKDHDDEPAGPEAKGDHERRGEEEEKPDREGPSLAAGLEGENERDDEGEPAGAIGRGGRALGGPPAHASERRPSRHFSVSSSGPSASGIV